MRDQNGREDRVVSSFDVRNIRCVNIIEVAKRACKRGISPPDVAGRPDRSPGQASGKRAQKTAVLIEVPVSGRLGYLTIFDAWVHYSFLRIIMTQRKGPRRINSSEGHRVCKDRSLVPGRLLPHGRNGNTDRYGCHYSRERIIEHGVMVAGRW